MQLSDSEKVASNYYLANILSWSMLGIYVISLNWYIANKIGNVAAVGWFYCAISASSLLVTPFFNSSISNPMYAGRIMWVSAIIRASSLLVPLGIEFFDPGQIGVLLLVLAVAVLYGPSSALYSSALDGILLRQLATEARVNVARRVVLIRQVSLTLSAIGTGFCISSSLIDVVGMVSVASIVGFCIVGLSWITPKSNGHTTIEFTQSTQETLSARILKGVRVIKITPLLVVPVIIYAFSFSISQLSNALLPVMALDLHKSAGDFSLVSSSWGVGALIAAFLGNVIHERLGHQQLKAIVLGLFGLLCFAFAVSVNTFVQIALFSLLGACFALIRIFVNAEVTKHTKANEIGLVNLAISNILNVTALFVYLIPTIAGSSKPAHVFAFWGILIVCTCPFFIFKIKNVQKLMNTKRIGISTT